MVTWLNGWMVKLLNCYRRANFSLRKQASRHCGRDRKACAPTVPMEIKLQSAKHAKAWAPHHGDQTLVCFGHAPRDS